MINTLSPLRAARRRIIHETMIYLVATVDVLDSDWMARIQSAIRCDAVKIVQLRTPSLSSHERIRAARALRDAIPSDRVLLILNDDVHLAEAYEYDGAHVGQDDMNVQVARAILGDDAVLGLSTHNEREILMARLGELDLLGLGPCFPTSSKVLTYEPAGAALVERCLPVQDQLCVFPIGGIDVGNIESLVGAGARHVAVGHAILGADDPETAAHALAAAMMVE